MKAEYLKPDPGTNLIQSESIPNLLFQVLGSEVFSIDVIVEIRCSINVDLNIMLLKMKSSPP